MESFTYFALGVSVVLALAFVSVTIMGIVMAFKLRNNFTLMQQNTDRSLDGIHTVINERFDNFDRHHNNTLREVYDCIKDERQIILEESKSYTDKRIDKFQESLKTKSLIKG